MAKSLNKAFIKAYTKGKATINRRDATPEVAASSSPELPGSEAHAVDNPATNQTADNPPGLRAEQPLQQPAVTQQAPASGGESASRPEPPEAESTARPIDSPAVTVQRIAGPLKKRKTIIHELATERTTQVSGSSKAPSAPAASSDPKAKLAPLMSRIDTATVEVPAPHFLNRKQSEKVAAASPLLPESAESHAQPTAAVELETSAQSDPTAPTANEQPIQPQQLTSDGQPDLALDSSASESSLQPGSQERKLRVDLAFQNLAATIGNDFRIDAFSPGYPAAAEQPELPQVSASSASANGGREGPAEENRPALQVDESEVLPSHHPGVAGTGAGTKLDSDVPVGSRQDKPHSGGTSSGEIELESEVPEAELSEDEELIDNGPKELESLEAPALSESVERKLSFEEVEQAVRELAKERKRSGEIFRLDRPSYSTMQSQTADAEELSESLSETDFSDTQSQEIQLDGFLSKTRMTRAMEEGLRQARARVFNPVWEVDNFQWPDVCGELLEAGHDNMQKVAANLNAACQEGLQVMAVTSPGSGAGTTTVSCCLAMLAGMNGMKVAILDGDLENPTLSIQTNLDIESDWKNAILGQMSLEEVAVHSIDDQVTLLPLIQPIDQAEMASDDDRIYQMMQELSDSFDLVIIDAGHIERNRSLINSLGEQGVISAVVTVIDKRHTSQQAVDDCIRRIRQTGIASIGLVENFAA